MNEVQEKPSTFNKEEIQNFSAFSNTLKRIHIRLVSEGYTIKDGLILKPEADKPIDEKVDIIGL